MQALLLFAPTAAEYVPRGHSAHASAWLVAFAVTPYEPAGHGVQLLDPGAVEKVPARHVAQTAAPGDAE